MQKNSREVIPYLLDYLWKIDDVFQVIRFEYCISSSFVVIKTLNTRHRFTIYLDFPKKLSSNKNPESQRSEDELQFTKSLQDYFLNLYYIYEFTGQKVNMKILCVILDISMAILYNRIDDILLWVWKHFDKLYSHIKNPDEISIKEKKQIYSNILEINANDL